jgi:hypothetical protein
MYTPSFVVRKFIRNKHVLTYVACFQSGCFRVYGLIMGVRTYVWSNEARYILSVTNISPLKMVKQEWVGYARLIIIPTYGLRIHRHALFMV